MIEGEAGIGKTRLANELARQARAAGAVVLAARCHDDEAGLPYGPVVELLREAVKDAARAGWPDTVPPQRLADASLLLPELAELRPDVPDPLPLDGPGAQVRLLEGVAAVISAACAGPAPGVVFLDDVHAADEATVDAIAYLGRRLRGRPMLLVIAWRSEAVPPGHRLRRLALDLVRERRAAIVSPARLDEDEVATLVQAARPSDAVPDLVRRVYVESEGLPLFVAEYLAALRAGGGPAEELLPTQVRSVLDARLGDSATWRVRYWARRPRSAGPSTSTRCGRRADAATRKPWARSRSWSRRASCAKLRDRSRSTTSRTRSSARSSTSRQASHGAACSTAARRRRCRGGGRARRARRSSLRTCAWPVITRAQRSATVSPRSTPRRCMLTPTRSSTSRLRSPWVTPTPASCIERIGDLRTLLGDYGGALASYESAAAQSEPSALAAIEHKLGDVHHRRGEWERAETHFLAALEAAPAEERGLRARIQADLALTLHHAGRPEHATTLAHEALALAETAADLRAQAQAHNMLGVLARNAGEPQPALVQLERSLALARELRDDPAQAAALNNLALVKRDAGELAEALALTESALALCAAYGDRHREAALENNLADLHHAAGDDDDAMVHLKRAVAIFTEVGADDATRLPEIWKLVSW